MALTASTAQAAVMYDGVSYAQDFNALPIADNSNFAWAQDDTLPGWYFDTSGKKLAGTDDGRALVVASDAGRTSTDRLLSLATDTDSTNAAMGMRGVGWQTAPDGGAFAVRLRNDSGAEITELSVGFTVQQWMRDAAAGTMSFYYYDADGTGDLATLRGTDGDDVDIDSVGTLVSALSYTAPHTGEAAMLDGTLAENSSVLVENITGLSWAAGEDLWLAWDKPTADSVLAIDDLHITPEPATMSLLGLGGLVALRRRRNR
jgi:hypothetical protein